MFNPPLVEFFVWLYIETLFRRGGLRERIADIGTEDKEIFRRAYRVEEARAGLVNTVRIDLVKDFNRARTAGPVAHAASFLTAIQRFNIISPN